MAGQLLHGWRIGINRVRGQHQTREWLPASEYLGTDLTSPARQAAHVVEPGILIHQTLVAHAVRAALRREVRAQLQQQAFAVERLSQELPSAGPVGIEALDPTGRASGRNQDRNTHAEAGIFAKQATYFDAVQIGHLGIQNHKIRSRAERPIKRLLTGICTDHRIAIGSEDALERTRGPLLIIGQEDKRRW